MITLALPKGRILEDLASTKLGQTWGIDRLLSSSRKLIRDDVTSDIRYLLLKPDDVPTYVEYGAADMGIVGRDVLMEHEHDLYILAELPLGRCRMCIAGPTGATLDQTPLRVATKYHKATAQYFARQGTQAELISVRGSVELAPLLGLSHVIVDLVQTGQTLKQNSLHIMDTIASVSSVVIANRVNLKLKHQSLRPVIAALKNLNGSLDV